MDEERSLPEGQRFTRRSATFIGSFTFAARIVERLGAFGQIALIASIYGSSFLADRYFIASIVPLIIGGIMGEALSANIMPALVRRGSEAGRLVAGGFWLATGLLVVATVAYVGVATIVVQSTAPTGSSDLGVWYAFAPIGLLLGLSGYLSGVLTYYERYVWPPFRSAIATVGGFFLTLLALAFTRDLVWLAAAISVGYALSFLTLLFEIRRVVGPATLARPGRDAVGEAFALRGGLSSPVVGGLLGGQIFVLLERALASTIGVGAVSTLSYARGVVFTPVIAAQSIALGLYPGMVRAYEVRDLDHVRGSLLRGLRVTLFLAAALASFFAAFGRETIDVLLQRGAFDPSAAADAARVLSSFALALVGNMLMVFVARVFYAVGYFRAVVWSQLWALVVYAVVALPLRAASGTSGLALAFGIAEASAAVYGLVLAGRRIGLAPRAASGAVLEALARAALVAASVWAIRLVFDAGALESEPRLRLALALIGASLVGGIVLWTSGWPEVARLKRGVSRVVSVRFGA
jgi:putative peptidoglycan lipid II flippase